MERQILDAPVSNEIKRPVRNWLLIGVVMVFMQVVIGGVTRLTDSGLSITEWAVIQGTLPPMNLAEWNEAFDLYKVAAKKQYETLHADMTLSEFKVIFFWEYFHRLWARLMGFVFLFPFLYFLLIKKWIPKWLLKRLGVVILLAATAATFGWIMVASGLNNDTRTWVSAYKLAGHLSIATTLFAYLFWTWLLTAQPTTADSRFKELKKWGWGIVAVLGIQIIFGGLMAGMRAGLIHPHFPFFVEGERLLNALSPNSAVGVDQIVNYEQSSFAKATVQVMHRGMAYLLSGLVVFFFLKIRKADVSARLKAGNRMLIGMLIIQFLLGVLTVINSVGKIPLFLGVAHQGGALLLLICLLYVNFQFKKRNPHFC
ncbi:MAG: COX15/CtaA family protein [Bacteroidota bacterium]